MHRKSFTWQMNNTKPKVLFFFYQKLKLFNNAKLTLKNDLTTETMDQTPTELSGSLLEMLAHLKIIQFLGQILTKCGLGTWYPP